jgi:predicted ester cyclase
VADDPKSVVQGFLAAMDREDHAAAARHFHRQYRSHSWGGDLLETWRRKQVSDAAGELSAGEWTRQSLVAEGDRVVLHSTLRATHAGVLLGVEGTARSIEFHSLEIWRIQDGKIIEHWGGLQESRRLFEQLCGRWLAQADPSPGGPADAADGAQ